MPQHLDLALPLFPKCSNSTPTLQTSCSSVLKISRGHPEEKFPPVPVALEQEQRHRSRGATGSCLRAQSCPGLPEALGTSGMPRCDESCHLHSAASTAVSAARWPRKWNKTCMNRGSGGTTKSGGSHLGVPPW